MANNGVKRYKGAVEYVMPQGLADSYVKMYKETHSGKKPADINKYLLSIVNEEFGLKTPCVRVIVE